MTQTLTETETAEKLREEERKHAEVMRPSGIKKHELQDKRTIIQCTGTSVADIGLDAALITRHATRGMASKKKATLLKRLSHPVGFEYDLNQKKRRSAPTNMGSI